MGMRGGQVVNDQVVMGMEGEEVVAAASDANEATTRTETF